MEETSNSLALSMIEENYLVLSEENGLKKSTEKIIRCFI